MSGGSESPRLRWSEAARGGWRPRVASGPLCRLGHLRRLRTVARLHFEKRAPSRSGIVAASTIVTPLPISLCVNTRNAATLIAECLESCTGWVSEVVVVDMESEDDTVEVARKSGARVIEVPHRGIVELGRQVAIDACTQPWALVLDADERAPAGLRDTLATFIADDAVDGVFLPVKNYLFGKHIRHSGYWPDWQLRFFRPAVAHQPQRVHSRRPGRRHYSPCSGRLRNALIHHNYSTVRDWFDRNNRYTDFEVDHLDDYGYVPKPPAAALSSSRSPFPEVRPFSGLPRWLARRGHRVPHRL